MAKISTDQSYAGGNIAFIIVVAITYIMILFSSAISGLLEALVLVGLGLAFLLLGLFGPDYFDKMPSRFAPYLYFALLIPLGVLILYLSDGTGWLILMPVVSQVVVMLPRRGSYLVNGFIFGIMLIMLRLWGDEWMGVMRNGLSILAAMIFVAVFTQIAVSEGKARAEVERLASELEESNRKQREYAAQVETLATVQERNRLAREIHDSLGHYLTAINMQIKAAQAVVEQDRTRALDALEKAQSLAQEALADVRRSVATLRAEPELDRPLPEALNSLLDECRSTGVVSEFTIAGECIPLSPQVDLALYRSAQEGLTNVRKHALASRVDLSLKYLPTAVRLTVQDNGVGSANTEAQVDRFGLFGVRERIQLLGGTVDIQTNPGEGFKLVIEIPI